MCISRNSRFFSTTCFCFLLRQISVLVSFSINLWHLIIQTSICFISYMVFSAIAKFAWIKFFFCWTRFLLINWQKWCCTPSSKSRAGNEPNQLENSSRLDLKIESLNLVHEPNESNLSWKLNSLNKRSELELSKVQLVWFMIHLDIIITNLINNQRNYNKREEKKLLNVQAFEPICALNKSHIGEFNNIREQDRSASPSNKTCTGSIRAYGLCHSRKCKLTTIVLL